jgi:hypothetical protein
LKETNAIRELPDNLSIIVFAFQVMRKYDEQHQGSFCFASINGLGP